MELWQAAEKLSQLVYWLENEMIHDWHVEIENDEYYVDLGQFGEQTMSVCIAQDIEIDPESVIGCGPVSVDELREISDLVSSLEDGRPNAGRSGNDLMFVCNPYDTLYAVQARREHDDKDELHGPFTSAQEANDRLNQLRDYGAYCILKIVSVETNAVDTLVS